MSDAEFKALAVQTFNHAVADGGGAEPIESALRQAFADGRREGMEHAAFARLSLMDDGKGWSMLP